MDIWIEQLAAEGNAGIYPNGIDRSNIPVNQAEMAVFLVMMFCLLVMENEAIKDIEKPRLISMQPGSPF